MYKLLSILPTGLRYSSRRDDFVWANGETATAATWKTGHGKRNLKDGSCATLDLADSGSWANTKCALISANLVCEMPATV